MNIKVFSLGASRGFTGVGWRADNVSSVATTPSQPMPVPKHVFGGGW